MWRNDVIILKIVERIEQRINDTDVCSKYF